ncbi:MAG: hypothetical protein SangKO_049410 [Sandaracinaceae bacterium]
MEHSCLLYLACIASLLTSGCFSGPMSEGMRLARVQDRAVFDLDCESDLEVRMITRNTYGAVGCGHRATYVLSRCSDNDFETNCTVVLNGIGGESGPVDVRARPRRESDGVPATAPSD